MPDTFEPDTHVLVGRHQQGFLCLCQKERSLLATTVRRSLCRGHPQSL